MWHPRLPSGILLTAAGCGRATLKPRPDGSVNRASGRASPIYAVNEPGCGLDDCMVAAVTIPLAEPDPLETLLRRLLPTPVVPVLPPKPVPTELESLLQVLLGEVPGLLTWRLCCRAFFRAFRTRPADTTGPHMSGLGYDSVFLMWQGGTWSGPVP